MTRANSALRIGQWLQFYVDSALEKRTGGFLEDTTNIRDMVAATDRRVARQGETFDEDETSIADIDAYAGAGDPAGRVAQQERAPAEPGPSAGQSGEGGAQQAQPRPAAEGRQRVATLSNRAIEKVGGIDAVKKALQTEGASDADVLKLFKTLESTGRIDETKVQDRSAIDFLEGKKPVYVYTSKEDVAKLFGNDLLTRLDKYPSLTSDKAQWAPGTTTKYIVWYKPEFKKNAERLIELIETKGPGNKADYTPAVQAEVDRLRLGAQQVNYENLSSMTVKALRSFAKENNVKLTGLTKKADIIDKLLHNSSKFDAVEAASTPSVSKNFTTDQHIFRAAWDDSFKALDDLVRNDLEGREPAAIRNRDKFEGKSQVVFDRLIKNYRDILDAYEAGDAVTAREALQDAFDNAAQLDQLVDSPTARLFTQHARAMMRLHMLPSEVVSTSATVPVADKPYVDAASRRAFYDYLEGDQPVKGAAPLAKALRISVEEASNLIDDAIEMGWLKVNSKDQVIRVPKNRRPGRPDEPPSFMAEVVGFRQRSNAERYRYLRDKRSEINSQIDDLRVMRNELEDSGQLTDDRRMEINSKIDDLMVESGRHDDEIRNLATIRQPALDEYYSKSDIEQVTTDLRQARKDAVQLSKILNRQPDDLMGRMSVDLQRETETPLNEFQRRRAEQLYEEALAKQDRLEAELEKIHDGADAIEFADAPKGWDIIEGDDPLVVMERELQAGLSIQKAFVKSLHRVPDVIKMRMFDGNRHQDAEFTVAAFYDSVMRSINISKMIGKRKPGEAVPHELFHAVRNLKLITDEEWAIITNGYFDDLQNIVDSPELNARRASYEAYFRKQYTKYGLTGNRLEINVENKMIEEWAATKYGEWQDKRDMERETWLGRLFGRIRDFAEDLVTAFNVYVRGKEGPQSVEEIFRAIESGDFPKRWQEWDMGKSGPENRNSMSTMALADMADDLNAQMKRLASDDSEAMGNIKAEVLSGLAPCAAHHL